MTDVPTLTPDALVAELELIHRKRHRSFNTLVLARMSPAIEALNVRTHTGVMTFHVANARSEIELRAALPDALDAPPVAVLLDWDPGRLPADLFGRVADGRVNTIARARRLRSAFSHAQLSLEVEQCRPLADALLDDPHLRRPAPPGGLVTLDVAWRAWLTSRKVFGEENEREVTLLLRVTRQPAPAQLVAFFAQHPDLQREAEAWMRGALGPIAPWAVRLWLDGKGLIAGALAFVLDGARASLGAQDFLDGILSARLTEISSQLADACRADPRLLQLWADLASLLAAQCEDDAAQLLRLLDAADGLLPGHETISIALARSDFLRVALEQRKRTLADALRTAALTPTTETFHAAIHALDALGRHQLRKSDPAQQGLFERARMAARLAGWLAQRASDIPHSAAENDLVVLATRAEDYVRQGGFADLARRVARGSTADALGTAIQSVVARADQQRDHDDKVFAEKLLRWTEVGRPPERVLPIEAALDRFGVTFLREQPHRKLLILLLDGMSWDRAIELLESLESSHYAPLRWSVPGSGHGGVPPVLAALPTITDVSRAAFFAGQALRPGEGLDTSKDPVRLANHKSLRALDLKATLLLKGELQTPAGDASSDALDLVGRPDRVVALVVNAIDDQLKAGPQTRVEHTVDTIRPLRDLLERATLANRAVLLVSDHGHVSGARMQRLPRRRAEGEPGGARWRIDRAPSDISDEELSFGGSYVWRPPGVERIALITRETSSYGIATVAGEHGGATLAEVVTPAILVGAESLAERTRTSAELSHRDAALEVRPLVRPAWWGLRIESAPTARLAPATPVTTKATRPEPSATPVFPTMAPELFAAAPAAPAPPAKPSPWVAFFQNSKALKQSGLRMDPRFVKVIDALDGARGVLSSDRLAVEADVLASRVEGLIASMSEILNADGTPVIQYDPSTRLVRLDLLALREIFE